jgi:hypothetical protein
MMLVDSSLRRRYQPGRRYGQYICDTKQMEILTLLPLYLLGQVSAELSLPFIREIFVKITTSA